MSRGWGPGVARGAYTLAGYLLLPAVFGRLTFRGLRSPAYFRRWGERLGRVPFPSLHGQGAIWIHAVSVGEVETAVPLVAGLRQLYPERPLVVTTTTPTGSERVRARLGDSVHHSYLPYDLPGPISRFLGQVDPSLAMIMETELWPRLLEACRRRGIPLLVVNARLSQGSYRAYRRIPSLIRPALAGIEVLAQTEADAECFRELGIPASQASVAGNLKYDQSLPADIARQATDLRRMIGSDRPVWVAGSTHAEEEGEVLAAHETVRRRHPGALLVLVPRHPERFDEVAELCARRGLAAPRRSRQEVPGAREEVYLADAMGELRELYGAADVAFVGGSLVAVGGHNLLEPAAQGIPVVTGPNLANFREMADRLEEAGALRVVRSSATLGEAVAGLLENPGERTAMGTAGERVVAANRGARERILEAARARLGGSDEDSGQL